MHAARQWHGEGEGIDKRAGGITRAGTPVGHCAAALDVDRDTLALNLASICHLVRRLHVVLVLKLDEGVPPRLACPDRPRRSGLLLQGLMLG